jgi:hypothetical protein
LNEFKFKFIEIINYYFLNIYLNSFCNCFLLAISDLCIWGITPPPAIVALIKVSNSSSPLTANCKCLGVILLTFNSLLAFPANSNTSAVKYSKIAAV